jgi:hypothetical protein
MTSKDESVGDPVRPLGPLDCQSEIAFMGSTSSPDIVPHETDVQGSRRESEIGHVDERARPSPFHFSEGALSRLEVGLRTQRQNQSLTRPAKLPAVPEIRDADNDGTRQAHAGRQGRPALETALTNNEPPSDQACPTLVPSRSQPQAVQLPLTPTAPRRNLRLPFWLLLACLLATSIAYSALLSRTVDSASNKSGIEPLTPPTAKAKQDLNLKVGQDADPTFGSPSLSPQIEGPPEPARSSLGSGPSGPDVTALQESSKPDQTESQTKVSATPDRSTMSSPIPIKLPRPRPLRARKMRPAVNTHL